MLAKPKLSNHHIMPQIRAVNFDAKPPSAPEGDIGRQHGFPDVFVKGEWQVQPISTQLRENGGAPGQPKTLALSHPDNYRLMNEVEKLPTDDKAAYRHQIMAGQSWSQFQSLASRFGLTPSDRAKLGIELQPGLEHDDHKAKFLGVPVRDRKAG